MKKLKAFAPVAEEAGKLAAVLLVIAVIFAIGHHQATRVKGEKVERATAGAADIPGLNGYSYVPGLAGQFASLDPAAACRKWKDLAEPVKYGLAFVAPKAVPSCADSVYRQAAAKAHAGRKNPRYLQEGAAYHYDLGSPAPPSYYLGRDQDYSCNYLTKLVSTNYRTDPMPKPKDQYVWTAADNKAFDAWERQQQAVSQMQEIYLSGGRFAAGCYPPGAVFGKDGTITFYPNAPVKSLAETPAPVFTGHNLCNVCFLGPVYRVKAGDTLGKLATCFYGDQGDSYQIQYNNNLTDRDLRFLQIGQKLHIPDKRNLNHCVKPWS